MQITNTETAKAREDWRASQAIFDASKSIGAKLERRLVLFDQMMYAYRQYDLARQRELDR